MYYILLCVWLGNSPWSPLFSRLLDPGVNLDQLASRGPRSNPAVDRCARAIGHGRGPQASNDHMSLMQASHRFWGLGHISTYIYIYHMQMWIYIYDMYILWICIYIYVSLHLCGVCWNTQLGSAWSLVNSEGFFDFQVSLPFQGTHPTLRKMN